MDWFNSKTKDVHIQIDEEFYLSSIRKEDKEYLVEYLNDKDVFESTLRIPNPYTSEDAEFWIQHVSKEIARGKLYSWTIRNKNHELIGGIGFHLSYGRDSHKDEIGYWLGKPYWNRGIMTKVLTKFCQMAFSKYSLVRLEAITFEHNDASIRVLEKCGFQYEGTLKKFFCKDGKFINGKLYALVK